MASSGDSKPPGGLWKPVAAALTDDTVTGSLAQPMDERLAAAVHAAVAAQAHGPPAMLQPGLRLGRWELVSRVGRGGAAEVWVAFRERSRGGREVVAVKVILPHLAADKTFVRMFLDEARLLSEMRHPNVVRIHDVGTEGGLPYVALEFVIGDSLGALMASLDAGGEHVPLPFALRIVGEACLGLHMAHELRDDLGRELGVVHRDVSPPNILLSREGEVKLIDFGVAKALGRLAEQTGTGVLKGKVDYMAPEQAAGAAVDRRSDVWSIGVVLFELLCGYTPFQGGMLEVYAALKRGEPPRRPPASTPDVVVQLLSKVLQPAPTERFQTAAELRRGIQYAFARCCEPVTKGDLAEYVRENLAESLQERDEQLARALSAPRVSAPSR